MPLKFVAQPLHQAVSAKQKRPKEQGTFLSRPKCSEFVRCRKIAIRVVQDVRNREVIMESRPNQSKGSPSNGYPGGNAGAPGGFGESVAWNPHNLPAKSNRSE